MKIGQYWNGTTWAQLPAGGLTTADITLQSGGVANVFYTMKDKDDSLFILCYLTTTPNGLAKIIRITKNGIKTTANWGNIYSRVPPTSKTPLLLTRDNTTIFAVDGNNATIWALPTNFADGDTLNATISSAMSSWVNGSAAIYKDLYIWVASGRTVKIYDYTTKVELASVNIESYGAVISISCSTDNELYLAYSGGDSNHYLYKLTFDGINTITKTNLLYTGNYSTITKQLLIDPFGDLIILTNSGTASTLLKYTTAGAQIGTAITLANPSYNLNIGKLKNDGSYKLYYQTALKTFSVNNTTANAAIPALLNHVEIRGTGNTGFGSNYTGQQPSVYA
jgi:hypothetical protein